MTREFEASVWGVSIRFVQHDEAPAVLKQCEHAIMKKGVIIRRKFSVHHDTNGKANITDLEV